MLAKEPRLLCLPLLGRRTSRRLADVDGRERFLFDFFHYSNSDGLLQITHGEATQGWIIRESLYTHGCHWSHSHNPSFAGFEEFRRFFDHTTRAPMDFRDQLRESTGNMSRMTVNDRCVSHSDSIGMVQNDDLIKRNKRRTAVLGKLT